MLFFLHIEKAAGTSLRKQLYKGFGPLNVGWWGIDLDPSLFVDFGALKTAKVLIGGHRGTLGYGRSLDEDSICISVVRSPFDRLCSLFEFDSRYHPDLVGGVPKGPRSFIQLLKTNEGYKERIRNAQCHYLSGQRSFDAVSSAIHSRSYLICSVSHVDQLVKHLSHRLGVNMDLPERHNVNDGGIDYLHEYRQSEELNLLLSPLINEDQRLFELVEVANAGLLECVPEDVWEANRKAIIQRKAATGSVLVRSVRVVDATDAHVTVEVLLFNSHSHSVVFTPNVLDLFASAVKNDAKRLPSKRLEVLQYSSRNYSLATGEERTITMQFERGNKLYQRFVVGLCGELGQLIDSRIIFSVA